MKALDVLATLRIATGDLLVEKVIVSEPAPAPNEALRARLRAWGSAR
jgi:hypothetical protein